jgi:hypothetical protein
MINRLRARAVRLHSWLIPDCQFSLIAQSVYFNITTALLGACGKDLYLYNAVMIYGMRHIPHFGAAMCKYNIIHITRDA